MKVKRGKDYYRNDYEYLYGKLLIKNKSENLKLFLENELKKYRDIKDKIRIQSKNNERIIEITNLIDEIRGILNEFKSK